MGLSLEGVVVVTLDGVIVVVTRRQIYMLLMRKKDATGILLGARQHKVPPHKQAAVSSHLVFLNWQAARKQSKPTTTQEKEKKDNK